MENRKLSTFFSKNKTEQLPDDLWGRYVLPLNYNSFNLLDRTKATHVLGGRGSGKTMYLKYHCYPTILSKKKEKILKKNLERIGIYWKPDSDFLKLIHSGYLGDKWVGVFNTYVGLSLISELSKFINTLCSSNYESENAKNELINAYLPKEISSFLNLTQDTKLIDLEERCQYLRSELNDWLNYPIDKPPVVFAAKDKLLYIITYSLHKIACLNKTSFHIFIDEFENLKPEHQEIINSWMKHSADPLIFNVAYKKHYKAHVNTSGTQKLTSVHDYEKIDLETQVYGDYTVLAAEIVLSKIQKYYKTITDDVYNTIKFNLSDIDHLDQRNSPKYKRDIMKSIKKILPTYSFNALAESMLQDKAIMTKLRQNMSIALKESPFTSKDFIDKKLPKASIVNGALLNRQTFKSDPHSLKELFGSNSPKYKEMVNSTFLGAVLYLYSSYQNVVCPYYGGFNRFLLMSKNNIRHLLELCHKSLLEYESEHTQLPKMEHLTISVETQAIAARNVSKNELESKVPDLSDFGDALKGLIERLGDIYKIPQLQRSQSEPEKNHFSIIGQNIQTGNNKMVEKLLYEAKIWSILIEKRNTKRKGLKDKSYYEYHLHPIFSPYFEISPRQKRKFEFTYKEIETIFTNPQSTNDKDDSEFEKLYSKYLNKFKQNIQYKKSLNKKDNTPNLLDLI